VFCPQKEAKLNVVLEKALQKKKEVTPGCTAPQCCTAPHCTALHCTTLNSALHCADPYSASILPG
jgi:hypothetical protein